MKILLVESNYRARYEPLGLMKISRFHKDRGDKVRFVKGRKKSKQRFDLIYITTLFTYWYKLTLQTILFYQHNHPKAKVVVGGIFASLMPEMVKRYTGIDSLTGLQPEFEDQIPDQSLFPEMRHSIVHTSRGCSRKCPFCLVPRMEGRLVHKDDWERNVHPRSEKIVFFDNNWLAKDRKLIFEDIEKIERFNIPFEFNQGLDCRLFDEEIAQRMPKKIFPVYFAWDNSSQNKFILPALDLIQKYLHTETRIYLLYNFEDRPEYLHHRIREVVHRNNSCGCFLMRYQPLTEIRRTFVGKNWSRLQITNVETIKSYYAGVCIKKHDFYAVWGKDERSYLSRINMNPGKLKASLFKFKFQKKSSLSKVLM